MIGKRTCFALCVASMLLGCGNGEPVAAEAPASQVSEAPGASRPDLVTLRKRATGLFGALPTEAGSDANPVTDEKVELGRALYYDARLSKNHDVSCNSCHLLDAFGVDGEPTSPGHRGQRGVRNSPTVYNAALQVAQFWDGRASDVEEQAKGPVLNPVEMAMPSEAAVVAVLRSIPGYEPMFAAAFPGADEPISYEHMAQAIGAFERRLLTPGPLDAFVAGDDAALSDAQLEGLDTFIRVGCIQCHVGPGVGGTLYRKLGQIEPYATEDPGREAVTGKASDRHIFKVPALRNVAHTAPYFHDGSIASLPEAIRTMGRHQLGRNLDASEVQRIGAFLEALTGEIDSKLIERPQLPASGPDTPPPDPT